MELLQGNFWIIVVTGLATAMTAGLLGVFMVLRKLSLVSDALSHVALPGVALALLSGINPFIGAFAFLLFGAVIIAGIERRTDLPTDAIVGVLFSTSLALGILLTPEPELLEALFGDLTAITAIDAIFAVLLSAAVFIITIVISRPLTLATVAADLGHVSEKRTKVANAVFLIMLAAIVSLGIKFVGTLLMGTLTVIPAAAAKNIAKSLYGFGMWSVGFAALSVVAGMSAVALWGIEAGPAVVLSAAGIFLLTLLLRPQS